MTPSLDSLAESSLILEQAFVQVFFPSIINIYRNYIIKYMRMSTTSARKLFALQVELHCWLAGGQIPQESQTCTAIGGRWVFFWRLWRWRWCCWCQYRWWCCWESCWFWWYGVDAVVAALIVKTMKALLTPNKCLADWATGREILVCST